MYKIYHVLSHKGNFYKSLKSEIIKTDHIKNPDF